MFEYLHDGMLEKKRVYKNDGVMLKKKKKNDGVAIKTTEGDSEELEAEISLLKTSVV